MVELRRALAETTAVANQALELAKKSKAKADWVRRYMLHNQGTQGPSMPETLKPRTPTPLPPLPAQPDTQQGIAVGVLEGIMKGFAEIVNLKEEYRPRYAPAKEPEEFDGTRKSDVRRFVG